MAYGNHRNPRGSFGSRVQNKPRGGPKFLDTAKDFVLKTGDEVANRVVSGQDPMSAFNTVMTGKATKLSEQVQRKALQAKVKTSTKTIKDGKGGIVRATKQGEKVTTDLTIDFTQVRGYQILNENGQSVSFESDVDTSLYENPYVMQDAPGYDKANYNRTVFNVISPQPFTGDNGDRVLQDIFSQFKQSVNANTNGGNKVTDEQMTYDKFRAYITDVYALFYYLIELMTRQAWAAEEEHSNRALRRLAFYTSSDTLILETRNELANVLSSACLPREMVRYCYWLNQVYKTNDHNYAVEQFIATETFADNLLGASDISAYNTVISEKVDAFRSNIGANSQLTALLMHKSGGNFVSLRNVSPPVNTSQYSCDFNDIFQNMSGRFTIDGRTAIKIPATLNGNDVAPCAFSNSVNTLPNHVTESLLEKWSNENPLMFRTSILKAISTSTSHSSRYVMVEDDTAANIRKFYVLRRDTLSTQIGDDLATVEVKGDGSGFWYVISPKGEQSYLYDPAPTACRLAQRRFANKLFS